MGSVWDIKHLLRELDNRLLLKKVWGRGMLFDSVGVQQVQWL